jgi:hypothetical protein
MRTFLILAAAWLFYAYPVHGKAVFAHFMVREAFDPRWR